MRRKGEKSVLRYLEKAGRQSPSNDQLTKIWPPWNALPAGMSAFDKKHILQGDIYDRDLSEAANRRSGHLATLRQSFPYLPLGIDYRQALQRADLWCARIDFYRKTSPEVAKSHGAFASFDFHSSEEVAIFRAVKEIQLTESASWLDDQCPTLQKIDFLESRYRAYLQAHHRACKELHQRIYPVIYRFLGDDRKGKCLPLDEVALGYPSPPDDIPRHLFIARLDALDVCSPERFAAFMQEDFPKLSKPQRQEFYRMSLTSVTGNDAFAPLAVWLLDNRPVLQHEHFRWQWNDVREAAESKQISVPRQLKQWAHKNRLGLKLSKGSGSWADASHIQRAKTLLSDKPIFAGAWIKP